jgi:hypothetical protein
VFEILNISVPNTRSNCLIFRSQHFRLQEVTKQFYTLLYLWSTRRDISAATGTVIDAQLAKKFSILWNPSSLQCSQDLGNGRYGLPTSSISQSQIPILRPIFRHVLVNLITPELNPSAQSCLTRYLLGILLLEP